MLLQGRANDPCSARFQRQAAEGAPQARAHAHPPRISAAAHIHQVASWILVGSTHRGGREPAAAGRGCRAAEHQALIVCRGAAAMASKPGRASKQGGAHGGIQLRSKLPRLRPVLHQLVDSDTSFPCTHRMAWLIAPPNTSLVVISPGQTGSPAASADVHPSGRCTSLPLDRLKIAPLPHVHRPAMLAGARQA